MEPKLLEGVGSSHSYHGCSNAQADSVCRRPRIGGLGPNSRDFESSGRPCMLTPSPRPCVCDSLHVTGVRDLVDTNSLAM